MLPQEIDGRTLVIIRWTSSGYSTVDSGRLSYDGESIYLENETGEYKVIEIDLDTLRSVTAGNRISACNGFDFFLLLNEKSLNVSWFRVIVLCLAILSFPVGLFLIGWLISGLR